MLKSLINPILDASIFWSFDRSGFKRHAEDFTDSYKFSKGQRALITGGTSGIGKAAAKELARLGVEVTVTGRDKEKGEKSGFHFMALDLGDWAAIDALVEKLPILDFLVLNAGGMPEKFTTNDKGVELQFASQLFGHYLLAKKLLQNGKLKEGARIVWVTSGGMYLKTLETKTIFENPKYDKVETYANVKRAQVTLLPFFKEEFPNQTVTAMHPGWANTPGVKDSIPQFFRFMKDRLRTPLQGADTILWLLGTKKKVESGGLYFDRKRVAPHLFWFTKKSEDQAEELKKILRIVLFQ